jgi:hypothetical protein
MKVNAENITQDLRVHDSLLEWRENSINGKLIHPSKMSLISNIFKPQREFKIISTKR